MKQSIAALGSQRDDKVWGYFKAFQKTMRSRVRVPEHIIEKYSIDICLMVNKDETLMEAIKPRNIWIEEMGYEVDGNILDAYAKMLIDAPIDEAEKPYGTAQRKTQEVETKFNRKKREKQEGKASKFVENVSKDIKALIDDVPEKGRKRKDSKVHNEPVTAESKSEDDTPLSFKRVVRNKPEETKAESKKKLVRKVTIKISAQNQAPKATPSTTSGTAKRKKKNETDSGKVPPKIGAELVHEITKDGMIKNVQLYYDHLEEDEQREVEEAILLYLDIYKKALIEIENQIPTVV